MGKTQGRAITVGAVAAALALAGCAAGRSAAQDPGGGPPPTRVAAVRAREALAARPIEAIGLVADREQRELGFETGGRVAAILVDETDVVRPGQVIARLDTGALDAQLAQAQAAVVKAERDAARAATLEGSGSLAPQLADDAETGLDLARASLRLARHHRAHSAIVAPHGGTVLRRLADPGEVVAPGAPVIVLSHAGEGRVARLGIVDRDVVRLAIGDRAVVRLDALPDARLEGRVVEIAEVPTPGTGTFAVEVALPEDAAIPRVGLVARATLEPSARTPVVLIPVEALFEAEADRGAVFVVDAGGRRVERRAVRPAYLVGGEVAIAEGLRGGERVVVTGLAGLADGSPVAIASAAEAERRAP